MPASGPPTLSNPRGEEAEAWVIAICVLSFVLVVARVLTRLFVVRNPGFDDIAICVAWVFNLGLTIGICFEVKFGMGLHQEDLSSEDVTSLFKSFWVCIWIYHLSIFWTKVALITQYLRLFTQPLFQKAAWSLLIFVCLSACWTVFGSILSCIPVSGFWNHAIKSSCLPRAITWYFNAGLNIANDLMVILLPMPVLKNLNMPFRQRLALMIVFALGGFVCITSIIRIKNLHDVSQSSDISYTNVSASVWSGVEASTGIICAALPALKATVTRFFPKLFPSSNSASRSNNIAGKQYNQSSGKLSSFGPSKAFSRTDRTKICTTNATERGEQITELETFDKNGRGRETRAGSPSDGEIGVTTVMEQEVEHLDKSHKGSYSAASKISAKDDSDSGSESGLFATTDFVHPRTDKNYEFTHYRP